MLVARKLDEIVNALQLPEDNCFKTTTTDNASNMKIACRDSLTLDKHLSCFDHSLNLVVNAGINSVEEIKRAVEKFRKLVTGCHKSNLYCERIKRACSDLNHLAVLMNQVIKIHKQILFRLRIVLHNNCIVLHDNCIVLHDNYIVSTIIISLKR